MKLTHLLIYSGVFMAVSGTAIIDPSLQQRFLPGGGGSDGGENQNVMVSFSQGIQPIIDQINGQNFSSPMEKRTALTEALQSFTNSSQSPVRNFLDGAGVQYDSFWITNKIIVPNASLPLVNSIANIPGVSKIEREPEIKMNPLDIGIPEEGRNATLEWGIRKIRADQLWGLYQGAGVVVAGIDTGVRYTHEALIGNWRQEKGWLDPYFLTGKPNDPHGHGTHTIGTIVGGMGIGVAPNATWFACRGCNPFSCHAHTLLKCGQFVQCPTDRWGLPFSQNCSLGAHVVSNSWGSGEADKWYDDVIRSWQTAGMIPVFAIGNSGYGKCTTVNSPGDRPNVISVGSTDQNDQISDFSSLGPSKDGKLKPEISAPGGKIKSAWFTSDRAYNKISGTSMACPHVSGVVALMLEKNPRAKYQQVFDAIKKTANTKSLDTSTAAKNCGGISATTFPNNVFGYGRIDALDAVTAI